MPTNREETNKCSRFSSLIEDLRNLKDRLVDDYNGWENFSQKEEDRIAVSNSIETLEAIRLLIEYDLSTYPLNYELEQYLYCLDGGYLEDIEIKDKIKSRVTDFK